MSATKICERPCETCLKEGLPILLTRYAVLPEESKAPKVGGQLADAALNAIALKSQAQYGLRLLRTGYVYGYDEARKRMDEYFVTNDGFLTKMPYRQIMLKNAIQKPATEFQCARQGAFSTAGFISIPKPKYATKIWISFSDAAWTNKTYLDHLNDAGLRAKHMVSITISGGKVASQPYTAPIEEVSQHVAEYHAKTNPAPLKQTSPFQFNKRAGNEQLKATIKLVAPEGGAAIVALPDPVGIATELAHLMEHRKADFISKPELQEPMLAASTIATWEDSIKEQAKLDEVVAGEMLAEQAEAGPSAMYASNPALWGVSGDYEAAEKWRDIKPAHLEQVANKKWQRYTHNAEGRPRFDDVGRKAWQAKFDASLKAYDKEMIAPLANAHVAWLQSEQMTKKMTYNFDQSDIQNGVAYLAVFIQTTYKTGDKQPCHDLYTEWLKDGKVAAKNLLMRALSYNQEKLASAIAQSDAVTGPQDIRMYPNDTIFALCKEGLADLPKGAAAYMGSLLDTMSGAVLSYMGKLEGGKASANALNALGAANGRQILKLPVIGNRGKFIQKYIEALYALDPHLSLKANPNQLGKAIAAQIRLLEIQGLKTSSTTKLNWYVMLDKDVLKAIPAGTATGQAWANQVAKAIKTPDDLAKIEQNVWKNVIKNDIGGGLLAGILQVYSFTKTIEDLESAMGNDKVDATRRYWAGLMALGGTAIELAGNALLATIPASLRDLPRLARYVWGNKIAFGGKLLGVAGAIFTGILDYKKSEMEAARGNMGLSNLYFRSAFLGGSIGFGLLALGSKIPFIGWVLAVLVGLYIIVQVMIEYKKDNKLQEWFRRCYFGLAGEKYPNIETATDELKLATQ